VLPVSLLELPTVRVEFGAQRAGWQAMLKAEVTALLGSQVAPAMERVEVAALRAGWQAARQARAEVAALLVSRWIVVLRAPSASPVKPGLTRDPHPCRAAATRYTKAHRLR